MVGNAFSVGKVTTMVKSEFDFLLQQNIFEFGTSIFFV
jgi:hypothetical protein